MHPEGHDMLNQKAKVQGLVLNKLTAFHEAEFTFSPGINVFIGANSTGKSHVMKIIYSLLKVCETADLAGINSRSELEKATKDKS